MGGALDCKMTNGVSEGVSGAAHVEGLLFASGTDGVKPEPEDLTRRTVSPADRGVLCDKRRPLLPPPPPQGESPPALDVAPTLKDDLEQQVIKEELEHHGLKLESGERPRSNQTLVIQAPLDSGEKMSAGTGSYLAGFSASSPQSSYEHYLSSSPQPYSTSTSPAVRGSPAMYTGTDNYYRDYYASSEPQYVVRQDYASTDTAFVERYLRPPYKTNGVSSTLTVDLPSPADSGISADAITPRDQPVLAQVGALINMLIKSCLHLLYMCPFLLWLRNEAVSIRSVTYGMKIKNGVRRSIYVLQNLNVFVNHRFCSYASVNHVYIAENQLVRLILTS